MLAQAQLGRVRWPFLSLVLIAACAHGPAAPATPGPATAGPAAAASAAPKASTAAPPVASDDDPPFAMHRLDGPYPSIDAWCKGGHKPCFQDMDKPVSLAGATAPWLGAREIRTGDGGDDVVHVAIRTKAGWFVGPPEGDPMDDLGSGSLALRDVVPGGAPELVVHYVGVWLSGQTQMCTDRLAFCGLGASGRPSCTPSLPLREGTCTDPDQPVEWDWELGIRYIAGGRVAFAPKAGGEPLPAYAKKWVATYSLTFP